MKKKIKYNPQNTTNAPALVHCVEQRANVDARSVRVSRSRRGNLLLLTARSDLDDVVETGVSEEDEAEPEDFELREMDNSPGEISRTAGRRKRTLPVSSPRFSSWCRLASSAST